MLCQWALGARGKISSDSIVREIQKVLLGLKPSTEHPQNRWVNLASGAGEFGQLAQGRARDKTLMPMMHMKNLIFF